MDLEEVECIVTNLIFSKQIKGYIHHQSHTLVIHATEGFPSLSSLAS